MTVKSEKHKQLGYTLFLKEAQNLFVYKYNMEEDDLFVIEDIINKAIEDTRSKK